ncbi:MAG: pyruvate formate lyase-activating protein [Ruminococcaceae bacterium]|nr:pyruvate formate lyase-activating protein [Oscillospiraceae bacterium]
MMGRIHSIQSMSAVDGPGIRTVVFMQGCPLRCVYCHNPDTWAFDAGQEMDAIELTTKILRFAPYFKKNGGVTFSGGEPLIQAAFLHEVMQNLHQEGVHVALDTSGCIWNDDVEMLLNQVDMALLDIKMTDDKSYHEKVGCSLQTPLSFLRHAQEQKKPVWIRHVVVPGLNDTAENIKKLNQLVGEFDCIDRVELLPFRTLCREKYERMGIEFPLTKTPDLSQEKLIELCALVEKA